MTIESHSLNYSGRNRSGIGTVGVTASGISPAALAEALFKKRWQDALIKDGQGQVVGQVTKDENGARTWWGER